MEMGYTLEDVAGIISDAVNGIREWRIASMELDHKNGDEKIIIHLKKIKLKLE